MANSSRHPCCFHGATSMSEPIALDRGDDGRIRLPQTVEDAFKRGYSVIPMDAEKVPLVEWREFQERQPTPAEVKEWICHLHDRIFGWARITGKRAGIIVVDFDGEAIAHVEEWGISPHIKTKNGFHLILKHPSWYVKTCNSRSGKRHRELYPGVDIRGDGGYSLIYGYQERGGYTWLRNPSDIDELDVLPEDMRDFFGLLEAPEEPREEPVRERSPSASLPVPDGGPTSEYLIERALEEAKVSGRNNGGAWLVEQLRDHGYSETEIIEIGESYVSRCPDVNMKGEPEPYTMADFRKTVKSILSRPAREPWGGEQELTSFGDFAKELSENSLESKNGSGSIPPGFIDRYLVPTEIGALKEYPPWAIEGFVRLGTRGILYGVSGAAKSYVAVDLVRAAVTGGFWLGRKVRKGSTIYIAAEDYLGIHHRTEVSIRYYSQDRLHEARVFEKALAITNPQDVEMMKRAMDLLPEKPAYFIIDNLGLCMGDGDPNEGIDAKRFIDGCQAIQSYSWRANVPDKEVRNTDEEPVTVLIIHHTNKFGNFNGSQYFENFVDAMSELMWDRKSTVRTLRSQKQRHGERHEPLAFELEEVEHIDHICVVRSKVMPPATTDAERARRGLKPAEAAILDCLRLAMEDQQNRDITPDQEGLSRGEITLRSRVPGPLAYRLTNGLKGAGLVEFVAIWNDKGKLEKIVPERLRLTDEGIEVSVEQDVILKALSFATEQKQAD